MLDTVGTADLDQQLLLSSGIKELKAASSISAFLISIQHSSTCNCMFISFEVHRTAMLHNSCFVVLRTLQKACIQNTNRILLCKSCKLYQSLFSKSSSTLIRSLPTFGCHWLTKNAYLELSLVFQNFSVLFQPRSQLTQTPRLHPC